MERPTDLPSVAVVMGVSGSGKTTIGQRVAERLGWKFAEGDRLHPPENLAKMRSGQPLTDTDRRPWLIAIAEIIDGWIGGGECGVITCSALKRDYRGQIVGNRREVRLVYLEGSRELIAERLARRQDHFMPASLLDSQFATLEPPGPDENPIKVSIAQPIELIAERIAGVLFPSAQSPQRLRSTLRGTI